MQSVSACYQNSLFSENNRSLCRLGKPDRGLADGWSLFSLCDVHSLSPFYHPPPFNLL